MADVFHRSCQRYLQSRGIIAASTQSLWVLFVVDEGERNICDQKWIEVKLFEKYKIRSLRLTLLEVSARVTRDDKTGCLLIDETREIALVYYRTGYQEEQYVNEEAWKARTLMECSKAIKCPSIDVHLTTFKKFQQAFGDEELLQKVMGEDFK
jgi:glutathione synthase